LTDSIKAVFSHCIQHQFDGNKYTGFIRSSAREDSAIKFSPFPSATSCAFYALLNCINHKSLYDDEFFTFLNNKNLTARIDNYDDYKKFLLDETKNFVDKDNIEKYHKRTANKEVKAIILFERLLHIVELIKKEETSYQWISENDFIAYTYGKQKGTTIGKITRDKNKKYFLPDAGISPWFFFSLLTCKDSAKSVFERDIVFNTDATDTKKSSIISVSEKKLRLIVDNHLNYHKARYNVKEASFDPISLAIAVCCKIKLDSDFKYSPFFISCLKTIVEQQLPDGCFPTGATLTFGKSSDVLQQPSIRIATILAESIVDYKFLVDYNENIEQILEIIIPSFRKLAQYLNLTYQTAHVETMGCNIKTMGWSSDQLRIRDYTETWITSYACRFFYRYWLLEKAYARMQSLKYLGLSNFTYNEKKDGDNENKWIEIIDPDSILKPKKKLEEISDPIIKQRDGKNILILPEKNKLSFIICGPPGSGKTFIVESLAKRIGWPLVELSPSQFIKNGLDFIESTSKEIFDAINNLHHSVVFFDECDELFRDRSATDSKGTNNRTILSFLTASMLPKLQKLHEKRNVIFVVGTNYLQNMDKAIIREGRFDFRLIYDRPDIEVRKNYYKEKTKRNNEAEANEFADRTKTCYIQDLGKYLDSTKQADLDEDYINWCNKFANDEIELLKEIDASTADKDAKKVQWNELKSEIVVK